MTASNEEPGIEAVRASWAPYVVIVVGGGGLSLLLLSAARTAPSFLPPAIGTLVVCASAWFWLSCYALGLSDGVVTYRTLFKGHRTLPARDIARGVFVIGYEQGADYLKPFFRLVLEPRHGTPHEPMSINVNVFVREDIRRFEELLERYGVDIQ